MTKKKILLLGKTPPPYIGPAIATEIILNSDLNNYFELIHLNTKLNEGVESMGRFGIGKLFKTRNLYKKYKQLINQHHPDLVLIPISQTTMGFLKDLPFINIAYKKRVKIVIQLRGSNFLNWYNGCSETLKNKVKKALQKCDGVIVLGDCLKYLFEPFFMADKIFVVPNGANFSFPTVQKPDSITFLYFANFLPSKSFWEVLNAFKIATQNTDKKIQLIAAGAWDNESYKSKCLDFIQNHKLKNVTILPPQWGTEKLKLFAQADVFLFCPQQPEGHPWVIVEALAAGLPIIATDQGAIKESVISQKNGFLLNETNIDLIAEKIQCLTNDETLRKTFGTYSKKHYKEHFTEEKMVARLKHVFDSI
ncbi:MAG: hypothetical protein Kow0079_14310 [Vicingaceae bacterium]